MRLPVRRKLRIVSRSAYGKGPSSAICLASSGFEARDVGIVSTFVLIHGASDVGWSWHRLEAELRARARLRRVVAERLGVVPEEIAAGHCVALSRPKELADVVEGDQRG